MPSGDRGLAGRFAISGLSMGFNSSTSPSTLALDAAKTDGKGRAVGRRRGTGHGARVGHAREYSGAR